MNEVNNSNNKKTPNANLANAVTGNNNKANKNENLNNKEPNNEAEKETNNNETDESNEDNEANETEDPNTKKVTINTGNQSSMSSNMMPTNTPNNTSNTTPNININKAINNLNRNKNLTKKKNNISPQTNNNTLKNTPTNDTNTNANSETTTNVDSQTEAETSTKNANANTNSEKRTSINRLVMNLLNHQIVLKLFHFQTEKYGAHKASDAYLEKYANTMDKFLEVAQGIYGKVTLKKYTLSGSSHTDENIVKHLNGIITYMREKIDDVLDEYTELINIRDELVGDAEQLKYLLTFK